MSILGLDYEIVQTNKLTSREMSEFSLIISYGKERVKVNIKNHIHIYESYFFGKNYLKKDSLPLLPLEKYNGSPIIYQGKIKVENHARKLNDLIETDIDIVASSFFMVSRYEEVILKDRDEYNRFPVIASLAYRENFLDKPIVNEYIGLLWGWIDSFNLRFKQKKLWDNNDFAVCLTHDIDEIKRYKFYPPLGIIFRLIRQRKFKKIIIILFDYLKTKAYLKEDAYHNTFDYIINLEKRHNFNSSFYFMADGKEYSLSDLFLRKIILRLKKHNFEVGIHPGFDAFSNYEILKDEKRKLEEILGDKIIGGRQHYLKWEIPESWKAWENAGLEYDTTLGFSGCEGFRCGICHPFKPFDVRNNKVINIWEMPLIVMDGTLFNHELPLREKEQKLINLLSVIEKHKGVFVFLWHNSYMTELFTPECKIFFENFYTLIAKKKCLVSSARDLLKFWESDDIVD
jgi:hypothetical protein